jgi:hypothetical protein
MLKANTFEGGSDAATITTANSGDASGTPWDNVTIGAGDATAEYDDLRAAHGTLSARLATTATGANVYLRWDLADANELFTRFYLYLPSTVALPVRLLWIETSGFTMVGRYQIVDSGGTPRLQVWKEADGANAIGTVVVTRDTWVRIETRLKLGTTGVIEAKLFNSPEISTADDTVTLDPAVTTNTAMARGRFGWNNSPTNQEYWLDSIAVETTSYIGPYSEPRGASSRRAIVA